MPRRFFCPVISDDPCKRRSTAATQPLLNIRHKPWAVLLIRIWNAFYGGWWAFGGRFLIIGALLASGGVFRFVTAKGCTFDVISRVMLLACFVPVCMMICLRKILGVNTTISARDDDTVHVEKSRMCQRLRRWKRVVTTRCCSRKGGAGGIRYARIKLC